jgi:hypothetical protein
MERMANATRDDRRALALALRLGALYDWSLAAVILAAPPALFALLRFPPPVDPFLFRLAALPLLFFGLLYWAAGRRGGEPPLLALSLAFRGGGGAVLLALIGGHRPAGTPVYLAIALVDLAWALLWWRLAPAAGAKKNPPSQGDDGG